MKSVLLNVEFFYLIFKLGLTNTCIILFIGAIRHTMKLILLITRKVKKNLVKRLFSKVLNGFRDLVAYKFKIT